MSSPHPYVLFITPTTAPPAMKHNADQQLDPLPVALDLWELSREGSQ